MSTFATRPAAEPARANSVIGKSVTIHGQLSGREDVQIEGRVEGDVELLENRCTVGAGGHVQGSIKAKEVVVYGTINGNLEASERIEIKKNARVIGDLRAARPVIEEEAFFKGNIETVRVETPKPQPVPAPRPQAAAANAAEGQASLLPNATEPKR